MARFISLPFGKFDGKTMERAEAFVNLDRVSDIRAIPNYACEITFTNGKKMTVSRKYETLVAQILGKEAADVVVPTEEVAAAFEQGYAKACKDKHFNDDAAVFAKACKDKHFNDDAAVFAKAFTERAVEWLSTNPMCNNWLSLFAKEMKKFNPNISRAEEEEQTDPDDAGNILDDDFYNR